VGTSATAELSPDELAELDAVEVLDVDVLAATASSTTDGLVGVTVVLALTLITGAITSEKANAPVIMLLMILAFIVLSSYKNIFTARQYPL